MSERFGYCSSCESNVNVELIKPPNFVMCLDCGDEFILLSQQEKKFVKFVVGNIKQVAANGKKCKTLLADVGNDMDVQIVTNAKHIESGEIIVVALEGAVIPAGCDRNDPNATIVTKTSINGTVSYGILCDAPALGWVGGAAGVPQKLNPVEFRPGDLPPISRPAIKK